MTCLSNNFLYENSLSFAGTVFLDDEVPFIRKALFIASFEFITGNWFKKKQKRKPNAYHFANLCAQKWCMILHKRHTILHYEHKPVIVNPALIKSPKTVLSMGQVWKCPQTPGNYSVLKFALCKLTLLAFLSFVTTLWQCVLLEVYHEVILPSLLYASESWTVYSRHAINRLTPSTCIVWENFST